ncbi:MAG: EAL domain-containing protein [Nitrosomonadales bacterium]|nr:EAL domain-containing protein [Nitrosomonadales bacterium]
MTENHRTGQDNNQMADAGTAFAAPRFPLLRRLSITSLLAMIATAALLIFLYRSDQFAEHEEIAAQENEKTAIHLIHLLDDRFDAFVTATKGLDAQALRANPGINLFDATLDTVREHHVLKLKIFNLAGAAIFSTVKEEIGEPGKHPALLAKALRGETLHKLEFRKTFLSPVGELHDRYVAQTYMPLTHAGKRIGVIEIYADATPIIERIHAKTIQLALAVFGVFAALYAALFFSVRRADLDIADDTRRSIESEARLRATINSALDGVVGIDATGKLIEFNPAAEVIFGWQKEEVIGLQMAELLIPEHHRNDHQNGLARYLQTGESRILNRCIKITALRRDGTEFPIELSIMSIREGGHVIFVAFIRDITERKQVEDVLRESEAKLHAILNSAPVGIWLVGADKRYRFVNKTFCDAVGVAESRFLATTHLPDLLEPDIAANCLKSDQECLARETPYLSHETLPFVDGKQHLLEITKTKLRDSAGAVTGIIGVAIDITGRKQAEEDLHTLAFYDPLTQLPNRRLLIDRLKQVLVANARNKRQGALLFIDLDNFKSLNDTQGHDTGDLLLIEAAARLRACVRQGDTAARLGGDEFIVLIEDLDADEATAAAQTEAVGEKIRSALGQAYLLNGHEYHSTASIGATLLRGDIKTADEMLRRADAGLYQAKAGGRNTLRFFDPALQALVMARVAMENDLRSAVAGQEQFLLHYQPQVDSSGRMIGSEALVRWQHPERGMVSPAKFIPLAEETGLILPLGHWVLTTACQQLATWATRPEMAHLTVAVNVSAKQFSLPNFVEEVLALVDYFGVNPANLKLEITESMLLDNVDNIIVKMTALKARGINFSLDDFGTGYSSLSYLKRLPLYQLKIDQSFVRDVLIDPNDAAIAKTIVTLSQSMGLAVIAEGVETEGQRDFLAQQGCHNYQGYFFSRPLPIEQFDAFASSMRSTDGARLM